MNEGKKKNAKKLVSTMIHPQKISTFFIFILDNTGKASKVT